jgi:hypothetical protein
MNPDRDYDNDAEKAIIADIERVDKIKRDLAKVKRQRNTLVALIQRLENEFHIEPRNGNPDTLAAFQDECESAAKGGGQ